MKHGAEPLRLEMEPDPARWNETLLQLPCSHILQSAQWGQFKARHGWTPFPVLFKSGAEVRAAALVLRRRLPRLPWGIMYVPKGPLLDYSDLVLMRQVLSMLESLARREQALLIKIDPDIAVDGDAQATSDSAMPQPTSAEIPGLLAKRGWVFSSEQIQFKNTALLDVGRNETSLLEGMKSKARYNVRLAARKGIQIRTGGPGDLSLFYRLYAETSARDRFLIRPFEYYRDVWQTFMEHDLAAMLLAELEGQTLAGVILFFFGRTAWYMYGASSDEGRHLMPNHLLQWEAIRLCKTRGCTVYDLWGAPDEPAETDPMWGVYRFKEGLGARLVRHIGAYDFPTSRPLFFLYRSVLPRYLAFLRRTRHRDREAEVEM